MSVNEVLKQIKKEFNDSKKNSVIIDNLITSYFGNLEASEIYEAKKRVNEVISSLRNAKRIYAVQEETSYVSVNGCFTTIPTCIRLIRKPCKEFLQLSNYLKKYASYNLEITQVSTQQVFGKRNNYDVTSETLLAHCSEKCAKALEWLRSRKATTFKMDVSINQNIIRSSGYEDEREWSGTYSYSLCVILYSKKTGKRKDKLEVMV